MDHVTAQAKDEERRSGGERSPDLDKSDDEANGSYYYDDASNYEVYRDDDDDELDESCASE